MCSSDLRPSLVDYDQASLAISSAVYQALTFTKSPQQALAELSAQLTQIIRDGLQAPPESAASVRNHPITHCSEVVSHEY